MSARKPRKPGEPVYAAPRPRLRLLSAEPARQHPVTVPELRAALDDMQRRYKVQRARLEYDDDGPEAA